MKTAISLSYITHSLNSNNKQLIFYQRIGSLQSHVKTIVKKRTNTKLYHNRIYSCPNIIFVIIFMSSPSFVQCPTLTLLDTVTFLVHARLFWCFHNPPNSDMDYRIFGLNKLYSYIIIVCSTNSRYRKHKSNMPQNL